MPTNTKKSDSKSLMLPHLQLTT